jgi:hypothetical protein
MIAQWRAPAFQQAVMAELSRAPWQQRVVDHYQVHLGVAPIDQRKAAAGAG